MKLIEFDRVRGDEPDKFFEALEFEEDGELVLRVMLEEGCCYTISLVEKEDTSLAFCLVGTDDREVRGYRVFGRVKPEEIEPTLNAKKRCVIADIVNEIMGVEVEKYLDWETGEPVTEEREVADG